MFIYELLCKNHKLEKMKIMKIIWYNFILLNSQVYINFCCINSVLIDNIFKLNKNRGLKKELFEFYFDYFSKKIYDIGILKKNMILIILKIML